MRYYMSFTSDERIAIKKSIDEQVVESLATLNMAIAMYNSPDPVLINPNLPSVQADLMHFVELGLLKSVDRIAQISNGMAQ
jgi:hypothetical protein